MSQFMEQFKNAGGDAEGVLERFMDDEELFKECLAEFVTEKGFEQLQHDIEEGVYNRAFETAHALKGVVGNLGLTPLYKSLCVLVESLRGGNYQHLDAEVKDVFRERDIFLQQYETMK